MTMLSLLISLMVLIGMWLLCIGQIHYASEGNLLTVEQVVKSGVKALPWERHFAMVLDPTIIAPTTALIVFLCLTQWRMPSSLITAVAVGIFTYACWVLWGKSSTPEAHTKTFAGVLHAVFFGIGVWAVVMVLINTPRPEPVLLLALCFIFPAFIFVGNHMWLGIINMYGDASSYPDKPLQNPVGWVIIIVTTLFVWIRSYNLIPSSFWQSLN